MELNKDTNALTWNINDAAKVASNVDAMNNPPDRYRDSEGGIPSEKAPLGSNGNKNLTAYPDETHKKVAENGLG